MNKTKGNHRGRPRHDGPVSPWWLPDRARTLGGQVTNATFYTGVRVPDSARIGGADAGWNVM